MWNWSGRPRKVLCEEGLNVRGAFGELAGGVPLNPKHDAEHHLGAHRWGTVVAPQAQSKGAITHTEVFDTRNHQTPFTVFPSDARGFHPHKPEEDRINVSYENMLSDVMSLDAKPAARFESKWQKTLAYDRGLYQPRTFGAAKSADDVRIATNEFADKVNADDPGNACKHLIAEEMRCLQTYQYEKDPQNATKKCVKWFSEAQQCAWDQHKFNNGYTAIEGPARTTKRRPYIFYPDFNYA